MKEWFRDKIDQVNHCGESSIDWNIMSPLVTRWIRVELMLHRCWDVGRGKNVLDEERTAYA